MSYSGRCLAALVLSLCAAAAAAGTLEDVRARGSLRCGINADLPGFATLGADQTWRGFDVDLCRAVATATLGDPTKVELVPSTTQERLEALRAGRVDLVAHNVTWTLERDTAMGLRFATVSYYDGQGFMTRKDRGFVTALELDDSTLCVLKGTTSELNVKDYFTVNRMRYRLSVFETAQEALAAYEAGECSVLTSDQSQLYALRTRLADPDASEILPEVISKEPLSPVVRAGDDAWLSIVRWSLFAMIEAEELQITSANVERVREGARNPTVRRLLGLDGNPGSGLGLADDWAYQIIRQVGNYGEVFERNVGLGSPLKMTRGLNAVWSAGGLMYSPPFR